MKICRDYVGISCVDGTCPMANPPEHMEAARFSRKTCRSCFSYEGCRDCALAGTEYCSSNDSQRQKEETE